MGVVLNFPALDKYIEQLKQSGGMWSIGRGKFAIRHLEVEKLAKHYNIETDINLVHCQLDKGCAVVKAGALFKKNKYYSLGEVSPQNNDFNYPVAVAEKRAVDRAILKALGLHGNVYSDVELHDDKNNNGKIDLNHTSVVAYQVRNATQIGKLREILSDHKEFLIDLQNTDLEKFEELDGIIKLKMSQFNGGKT